MSALSGRPACDPTRGEGDKPLCSIKLTWGFCIGRDGWKAEFEKAAVTLSTTDQAKTSATALLNGIASYEQSAKDGSTDEAKRSFVETVAAFQDWADHAGIASSIKGL